MDLEEKNEEIGRFALSPGPLVQIMSVTVHPNSNEYQHLSIYGNIYAEFRSSTYGSMVRVDIYNRQRDNPELVNALGGADALTLNGPEFSIDPDEAFVPMFRARIYVKLFDGTDNVSVQESFSLDDTEIEGCIDQVKSMSISFKRGSLTLRYIAIPVGVNCRVEVLFRSIPNFVKQDSVNVNGNITARFVNAYGNYNTEECLLFKKHPSDFERVVVNGARMQLTRSWVSLPAYASLVIGFDLSEFQTSRKLVNETVEFVTQPGMMFCDTIMFDNLVIQVRMSWFPPTRLGPISNKTLPSPQGISIGEMDTHMIPTEQSDEMDANIQGDDEISSDEESESSSNRGTTWAFRTHKNRPMSSPAVEIFSVVVVGKDSSKDLQILGSIELLSNDEKICYIFKRDVNDAMRLTEGVRSSLILDDSRAYDDFSMLEMKFDLKDVDNHILIKGFKEWDESVLDYWGDQQLCCFVQGDNGFAAVHYSIFPRAVAAMIKISMNPKESLVSDLGCGIHGSIFSQFRDFDYSSRYNKDYYRVVLFQRIQDEAIQLGSDGSLPLSRSMLVVPSYSSLIIHFDLSIGASGLNLSYVKEIEVGENFKTIETNELLLHIEVDWCQIK